MIKRIVVLLLTVGLVFPFPIFSAVIGDFAVVTGDVTVTRAGKVLKPKVKDKVETADLIATGKNSNARVVFDADTMMALGPNTKLEMKQYAVQGGKTTGLFNQSIGLVQTNVAKKLGPGSRFEIQTPTAIAGVRGTAWLSAVSLALQPGVFSSGVAGAALAPAYHVSSSFYALSQVVSINSTAFPTAIGVNLTAGTFTSVAAGALPTTAAAFSTATVASMTATLGASAIPGVGAAGAAGAAGTSAATGTTGTGAAGAGTTATGTAATGTEAGTAGAAGAGTAAGTATVAGVGVGTIATVTVVSAVVVAAVVASNSKSDTTTTHSTTSSHHH